MRFNSHSPFALVLAFGMVCSIPRDSIAAESSKTQSELLSKIDILCKCTGLQRKSGVRRLERFKTEDRGYGVIVLMATDVATEEYYFWFSGDREIEQFMPNIHPFHYELPVLKDPEQRRVCLRAIERFDRICPRRPSHYGKPQIGIEAAGRFRVRYNNFPEKPGRENLSLFGNIYYLVTRKGTIFGIWVGE